MLHWTIAAARDAGAERVVVVVRPGEGVEDALPDGVVAAPQTTGEGTGAAVLAAREHVEPGQTIVILSGDVPLMSADTIAQLVSAHEAEEAAATLLTTDKLDPTAYGRIVRDADGHVERIVETKNPDGVSPEHLAIREINIGAYAFDGDALFAALDTVGEESGEIYLTAVFELFRRDGHTVAAHRTDDVLAAQGVNNRKDLMEVERHARRRILEQHALNGVSFPNPDSVTVDFAVEIGEDTVVEPGSVLRGSTSIGSGCTIGPNTTLIDAELGNNVVALHAYITTALVADNVSIGPFAYLRPGTRIGKGAKIGTYVEVKNSNIGEGTKIPHLSYIGDADIGAGSNIAAGNITANYHAGKKKKSRTTIGDGVKTGVDTMFVAPVDVGDGAYTAAGSVITEDVPPGALAVSRPAQKNVEGYAERLEKESGDGKP
ncbi:MAG: bifunctional UDP-N-acetylglucosamine pyrophosphorylase / glucosamine-phosphate N-acetyltransferase [Thermoleophilaceae bacterium]|jgi:bifunctional UDP-N-acetylglucosamine pyrophosphorylase/glucosamine-1-phosphate N-acetyltransferase|nr:bifunctional UDP-N-acetylglucosamine pyrophosphorylase / glucosamine-phosphate N-acetyltransferase [Thermoleophilaceae bacterium]